LEDGREEGNGSRCNVGIIAGEGEGEDGSRCDVGILAGDGDG
jgi:hypothetical protein